MLKIKGVDHLSLSVKDFEKSKLFYDPLLKFLGFKLLDEFEDAMGWTNNKTRLWIKQADKKGQKYKYRRGDVGFEHYAFQLSSRKDVFELQKYLKKAKVRILDPAGKYYDNYWGVYFRDPNGFKLEGMFYRA